MDLFRSFKCHKDKYEQFAYPFAAHSKQLQTPVHNYQNSQLEKLTCFRIQR